VQLGGQAQGRSGRAGAAQHVQPAGAPQRVLAADVLAGNTELVSDLGLGAAGGIQLADVEHSNAWQSRSLGVAAGGG
jgi:hypothetical protein